VLLLATSVALFASDLRFDLEGTVSGAKDALRLHVQLFSIETPFTAVAQVKNGEFRFRSLAPGDYRLAVVRDGLGEVRRTVVVSPSLADARGVVGTEITFSEGDAAFSKRHATVSISRLAVTPDAADLYKQARELLARQELEGAKRLLRRAVERAPDFADAWNSLGVLAFQRGDAEEAERCYRQAVRADREAFDAILNLGALLLRTGRAAEALAYNLRAVEDHPRDAEANAQFGMNHFQLGRFTEAEPYLAAAKRLDPANQTQPQLFLAEIYRQRGEAAAAIRELQELAALRPDTAAALRDKISALAIK